MAPWFQNWHPYVRPFAIHCKCLLAHSDVISQKKWGELGHDGWCIYQGRAVDWSSGTLTSTPTQASKNQFRLRLRAELSIDSDSDSAAMTSLRSRWILVTPTPSLAPDSKIDFISTLTPVRTSTRFGLRLRSPQSWYLPASKTHEIKEQVRGASFPLPFRQRSGATQFHPTIQGCYKVKVTWEFPC